MRSALKETQEPRGDRDLVHQGDKEALFEMQGHSTHTQTMHLQFQESGHGEEMLNILDEGWMCVFRAIMNSGATESVAPPTMCPHIPLAEFSGSRPGEEYRTAGGERLKNEGQRHMQAWTDEGRTVGMTYQVAEVTNPLNSGTKMCDAENVVAFTAEGSTMKNLWTGASMHFGGESGVYVLNNWEKRGTRGGMDFARQTM